MTQSELVGPGHFGLAVRAHGDPPSTITGIRAESSAGKSPTAGVVSIRVDRPLALSRNSSLQVRNFFPLHFNNLLWISSSNLLHLPACLPFLCLSRPSRRSYRQVLLALCLSWEQAGGWGHQCIFF